MQHIYLCIDLKTFYASVECVERGLDPFSTNLVVADESRGNGTICLAVSPKMKSLGVKNRCRIFEIPKNIKYIEAKPRMEKYIEYSANIYAIYLKYIAKEDIHVYSIDEAFLDVTKYLKLYKINAIGLAKKLMNEIYETFGITATAGIGTNLYLAKIALDIMSKHTATNIGWLNEEKYQKELWHHRPLKDFWQIGTGIENRLARYGIYDMYGIAHTDEKFLYKIFGVNAEFLIDHAWGRETCTIADIKNYKPKTNSISTNQVLFEDYDYEKARLVLKEMVELKSLELVKNNLTTDCINLYVGYSKDIVKATGGNYKLPARTNTYNELLENFLMLYEKTTYKNIPIRRIGISFLKVEQKGLEQLSMFINTKDVDKQIKIENTISTIKSEMGLNSILRGISLEEGATTKLRNGLIGGHNAK